MKKWTDDFIADVLYGLPKDKYQQRAKAELTDHLLELCADLEAGGYAPAEAQARAAELMGDPAELNLSFREEWVRRASNWKYCLGSFLRVGIHAVLVNTLVRWLWLIPMLLVTTAQPFGSTESTPPLLAFLFPLVNFLPGLWFCAHELHERFRIHPRHRPLILLGFLTTWFLEMFPFFSVPSSSSGILAVVYFLHGILTMPIFLFHFPLVVLIWRTSYTVQSAFPIYSSSSLLLCLLFTLFYRPKHNKPFMLSDKT